MEHSYKQFQMDVVALAPIHIGSGEKYTSREFIYEDKQYYFPDMGKFYHEMLLLGLGEKFEKFLLRPSGSYNPMRLNNFIADNRIKSREFGGYRLSETKFEKEKSTRGALTDISKFVRDGLGQPYVPCSSLKGAIRTILMNTVWKDENFVMETKKRGYKENKQVIPWGAKKNQPLDDIFHEIRVSDSQPLQNEDLMIVQKWDYRNDGEEKVTPLPLYRESLKPFTRLRFTITTTSDKAYELISDVSNYANQFYKEYQSFFLEEQSKKEYIQDNIQYPIYLGGGSGVWTKTVIHQADGIVQRRYARMKITKMVGKGVVKLTKAPQRTFNKNKWLVKNDKNLYEMGKACFMIKEIR